MSFQLLPDLGYSGLHQPGSATNFPIGSSTALTAGYQAVAAFQATDPHTGATWTATNASASQGGVQALT